MTCGCSPQNVGGRTDKTVKSADIKRACTSCVPYISVRIYVICDRLIIVLSYQCHVVLVLVGYRIQLTRLAANFPGGITVLVNCNPDVN